MSVGGNDALGHAGTMRYERAQSFLEVLTALASIRADFAIDYHRMLDIVLSRRATDGCLHDLRRDPRAGDGTGSRAERGSTT